MSVASIIGICAPITCFVLHVLVLRSTSHAHSLPRQLLTIFIVATAVILSAAIALRITGEAAQSVHAAILTLLYGYIYFHFFNMSETARRVRLLTRYVAEGVTPSQSSPDYSDESIFRKRIERLKEMGTLRSEGEVLRLQKGPLAIATCIIMTWRQLFFPDPAD